MVSQQAHRDQCTLVGSIYREAHVLELDSMACTRRGTYLLCFRVESTCPSAGMGSCAWHLVYVCVCIQYVCGLTSLGSNLCCAAHCVLLYCTVLFVRQAICTHRGQQIPKTIKYEHTQGSNNESSKYAHKGQCIPRTSKYTHIQG